MYIPGPSLIYAQVGAGRTYQHLGFTEQNVRVVTGAIHQEVSADYAAGMPADVQMMGEQVVVMFRLSRYVEAVLTLCKQRLSNSYSNGPGSGLPGALGALLGQQGNTYGLVIVSQYQSLAPFSDMLPGISIPQAYLAGDTEVELGVGVKVPQVTFRGLGAFGLDGSYSLFSSDLAGLSLPNPA